MLADGYHTVSCLIFNVFQSVKTDLALLRQIFKNKINLSCVFFSFARLCNDLDAALQSGVLHFSWPVLCDTSPLCTLLRLWLNCGKKLTMREQTNGIFLAQRLLVIGFNVETSWCSYLLTCGEVLKNKSVAVTSHLNVFYFIHTNLFKTQSTIKKQFTIWVTSVYMMWMKCARCELWTVKWKIWAFEKIFLQGKTISSFWQNCSYDTNLFDCFLSFV